MEYTKEVWNVKGLDIVAYGKGVIAEIPTPQHGGVFECVANAHLIAATPELYEALKSVETQLWAECCKLQNDGSILYAEFNNRYQQVKAALRKAEGK